MDKYDSLLLKNQLCFPTYAVANKIVRKYQPLLDKIDLTYTQYIVMMVMWEKKTVNEKELCEALFLKTNTVAPLIKRLKDKGYISIIKDKKDKRNLVISLTDKGEKLKEKAVDVPPSIAQEFNLTEEEAIFFYQILYRILNYKKGNKTMTIYDFKVFNQKGEQESLEQFEGKVLLVVNTATKCGFTPQYDALEKMYEELKDQGFEILDFPCDQFFHQAPGTDEEINQVCSLRFNTQFRRFKKTIVKGRDAIPLYQWLTSQNEKGKVKPIKWNFTKFLINRKGEVVARFEPTDKPENFLERVKEELNK